MRVTLNRPGVRNALDERMVAELTGWAEGAARGGAVRAAVLAGAGPVFCAGADAGWLARSAGYPPEENARDAARLAAMFQALDRLPFPLLGRVHGAALGGGTGLAAVCDIVVAEEQAVFGCTEVRLGIVPAIVSPYLLPKIGPSAARELFLTGTRFSAARARDIGLVHAVVPSSRLDPAVEEYLRDIRAGAPGAVAAAKALIARVPSLPPAEAVQATIQEMAERRAAPEGQEGLRAFLEKRKPAWARDPNG
ncbi:MAG: enoyl-CoA hydratase-related protein [Candidatus Methylomirabilales bacterium]